ncbi:MAG: EAL domain-containing protein [Ilumatobacteraceae bacterium]
MAWAVVLVVLFTAGAFGSYLAAVAQVEQDDRQQQLIAESEQRSFELATSQITSSLYMDLQRYSDLATGAGAFVIDHPSPTNASLQRWMQIVDASKRHPALRGLGIAVIVTQAELAAYAAEAELNPSGPLNASGVFEPIPPGPRPFYCFVQAVWSDRASAPPVLPAGLDYCALDLGAAMINARDSGTGALTSTNVGTSEQLLLVYSPVYVDGVVPATIAERRETFLAAIGTVLDPIALLDTVAKEHPDFAIELRYSDEFSDLSFSAGRLQAGGQSTVQELQDGWEVQVYGRPPYLLDHMAAPLQLLIAGLGASLLLALLVYVLGTSRSRALRVVRDKTDLLRHQALHDPLTGLPNRSLILDRLDHLLVRAVRNGGSAVVLFIDLDEFKVVNDTLGHEQGDELLRVVGIRLRSALRDADTVGRLGGDEFIALLDTSEISGAQPTLIAERILDVMRQPFELTTQSEMPVRITASVGVAISDGRTGRDLIRNADFALYQAKAAGKDRYEVFNPESQGALSRRSELEFDLRSALRSDQFELMYQPLYSSDSLDLTAVEALLRWRHPKYGLVEPDAFIPMLERTGQIIEVGHWVLHEACRQAALWNAGSRRLGMSVNVSVRQLDDDNMIAETAEALRATGLEPSLLTFEITETALMRSPEATAIQLKALKSLGVLIAIDDFGTGYSSLAYLQRFPVDCLKIDRTFVNAMTESSESLALLHTLVQLGKLLGLDTVAEGVETHEQLQALRDEQVDVIQGFLLSRPETVAGIDRRLSTTSVHTFELIDVGPGN